MNSALPGRETATAANWAVNQWLGNLYLCLPLSFKVFKTNVCIHTHTHIHSKKDQYHDSTFIGYQAKLNYYEIDVIKN